MGVSAGWYDDPWNQADLRWWDGQQWTGQTATTNRDHRERESEDSLSAGIEHLIGRDGRVAVIDVETTGVYNSDRIVEIAILTLDCDGRIHDEFETLVQPHRDVGPTWIHGIEASMVHSAPTFADVAPHVAARLDGAVIAGHNVQFDTRMVGNELLTAGIDVNWGLSLDTLRATGCKLGQACKEHGIELADAHRAIADARATARLLFATRHRYRDECSPAAARPLNVAPLRVHAREGRVDVLPPAPYLAELARGVHTSVDVAPYVQLLDSAMADLKLTTDERRALSDVATQLGLDERAVARAHREFVNGLIDAAVEDQVVTDDEYDQLCRAAALLQVDTEAVMSRIDPFRSSAEHLQLVPGMTVCFTGQGRLGRECIDRSAQEEMATRYGLLVAKSVTKKGPDLVVAADGDSRSSKARKARQAGIAICAFSEFVRALEAGGSAQVVRAASGGVAVVCVRCGGSWMAPRQTIGTVCGDCTRDELLERKTEAGQRIPTEKVASGALVLLVCSDCGSEWERPKVRGRRPNVCPDCTERVQQPS
ncbi:exonuclease domain-containing protein [Mycolicibacterium sp. 22603]|uniref:exonuclease domain-containing protein n=1 Tax=Mycolicibacterium sp. 22603 TaxID=3453950 RepID=UPI003F85D4F4